MRSFRMFECLLIPISYQRFPKWEKILDVTADGVGALSHAQTSSESSCAWFTS